MHIKPEFENKRIMKIRRSDIKKWIQACVDKIDEKGNPKYSFGSCLKYLSVMKSIFHYTARLTTFSLLRMHHTKRWCNNVL
ncbi:hypothetical protein [Brevibacillus sp. 1238]|uniref:hypothetical protein n=1 Tax=Brevibacillus sp. 1238 TaxID=2940565 RepID=UPI0024772257|nr:hypothetical protein [Brevibacillus sp. 1238]